MIAKRLFLGLILIAAGFAAVLALFLRQQGVTPTSANERLFLVGSYQVNQLPILLSIDTKDFSMKNLLDGIKNPTFAGIHEIRSFSENGTPKLILGTYMKGKLLISQDMNISKDSKFEFEDILPEGERVRALEKIDANGDGNIGIVVGTRPSGYLKYYSRVDGVWKGVMIDKVGATIHDILVVDSDGDGKPEVYTTTSTTDEAKDAGLGVEMPAILQYRLEDGIWKKKVFWKPQISLEKGIYNHPRYLFAGDFEGDGKIEIVAGEIGKTTGLFGLVVFKWNGKQYTVNSSKIASGLLLSQDVLVSSDIDGDGKPEMLIPTLIGNAIYVYKYDGRTWQRTVILTDFFDGEGAEGQIDALYALKTPGEKYKRLFTVTVDKDTGGEIKNNVKFYVAEYSNDKQRWQFKLVNSMTLPIFDTWGIFPI